MKGQGLSQERYAQRRGCTSAAVRKALRDGRITANHDGSIDPQLADRQWQANTNPAQVRGSRSDGSYLRARARREAALARLAELQLEREQGRLIDSAEVEASAFEIGRRIRERLQSLSDRVASVLVGQMDRDEIARVLDSEVLLVLEELSGTPSGDA